MNVPNPNRKLSAEVVGQLVATRLPHHLPGLAQDRAWLWLVTDGKPCEQDREVMKDIGFGFTPRPHILPDKRVARWYHACSNPVLRRGKNRGTPDAASNGDNLASLLAELSA